MGFFCIMVCQRCSAAVIMTDRCAYGALSGPSSASCFLGNGRWECCCTASWHCLFTSPVSPVVANGPAAAGWFAGWLLVCWQSLLVDVSSHQFALQVLHHLLCSTCRCQWLSVAHFVRHCRWHQHGWRWQHCRHQFFFHNTIFCSQRKVSTNNLFTPNFNTFLVYTRHWPVRQLPYLHGILMVTQWVSMRHL